MANRNLTNAKKAKNDEFYTQYKDIEKEIEAYLDFNPSVFRDKVVYCNCDDPFESNFFQYFANKFNDLGLKKLITTSYEGSPIAFTQTVIPGIGGQEKTIIAKKGRSKKAVAYTINEVKDFDYSGAINSIDVKHLLEHNHNITKILKTDGQYPAGDFRSKECIDLLEQSDIVVTNPPFSLFREYVKQLFDYNKKYLIIGSMNAITYKEIFPLIKDNKMWLGNKTSSQQMFLQAPKEYTEKVMATKPQGMWWRIIEGKPLIGIHTALWFTNLDHGRRHQPLQLQTMADNLKFSKHKELRGKKSYDKYDNYDAIEVPFTDSIPSDYDGVMGVPISFLDRYNPDQFEILGYEKSYHLRTKIYPKQVQIDKNGNRSTVTKLNDGAAIKVLTQPVGITCYVVDGEYFVQLYSRILIKHKKKFI